MRVTMMLSALALAGAIGAASSAFAQTPTNSRNAYEACRQNAVGQGLTGEARRLSIDDCLKTPGAQVSMPTGRSYGECRSAAIGQGLSGDSLRVYLDRCTNS
jgi:hypothetical protein